jgi:hypothetical protein
MLNNGIQQQINASLDLDASAIHPRAVVNHMLKCLRNASRKGGGLTELRTVRCFFILVLQRTNLDVNELMIDTEFREGPIDELTKKMEMLTLKEGRNNKETLEEEGKGKKKGVDGSLELRGTPVLAYGWGTSLWLGDTKNLSERAWF